MSHFHHLPVLNTQQTSNVALYIERALGTASQKIKIASLEQKSLRGVVCETVCVNFGPNPSP